MSGQPPHVSDADGHAAIYATASNGTGQQGARPVPTESHGEGELLPGHVDRASTGVYRPHELRTCFQPCYNLPDTSYDASWILYLRFSPAKRIVLVLALWLALVPSVLLPQRIASAQTPPGHTVTWDAHSLLVDGHRILLYSGEFHYWRLPSQQGWQDRLTKMKAAGLNAVSIYFDWSYHSWRPGQSDFTGVRDVDRLLTMCDRLGLYVLARVGPYMNAEADAGGLPGWLLTKPLFPRSQSWNGTVASAQYSPLYAQYSKEWLDHILPILVRHQVTTGGSVLMLQIENEYNQDTGSAQYMSELYHDARADGITVPIFHNDFYFKGDWSKLVDLYAFDSYPYGFSCCHQWGDIHFHGIDTWESVLRDQLKITTPMFVSELQGGGFDPWGGQGYDNVAKVFDGDWLSAIDQSALAQGTTMLNTYMFAGGTTWGYMGEPEVYTSYDYGAPIAESGELRPAYYAAHRMAMFLQSYGPVLAGADAAPAAVTISNPAVVVHTRQDPTSGQLFVFLRHGDPGDAVQTHLTLNIGGHPLSVPQEPDTDITVPGHGSALLTANVAVGPLHLNYSTSQVFTDANTAEGHYLVVYGPAGSDGETDFTAPDAASVVTHDVGVNVTRVGTEIRLDYKHDADPRWVTIQTASGTLHVLITTPETAGHMWPAAGMLLSGPDLVTDEAGNLRVWSSNGENTVAYGAPSDRPLLIDGRPTAFPDATSGATLLGTLQGPVNVKLPALNGWRFAAGAPEIQPAFNDSQWQLADRTSTNPNLQPASTLPMDDYGFHYGFVWYRGHFTATGTETVLAVQARHSYAVYLNGQYLGGGDASRDDPPHAYARPQTFVIPPGSLRVGQDNVISVLTESLGHDEGWIAGPAAESPQGLLQAGFVGVGTPITWRIQGDAGGEQIADPQRGPFNASGLFGERAGWYLPSFDDSRWNPVQLPDNWAARDQGSPLGWYRTHFRLNLAPGVQAPIGLVLPHVSDKAVVWLNGWLVGRYWEQLGPQHEFYLPAGVLNEHGTNTLAIAVWNRGNAGGLTAAPSLAFYDEHKAHTLAFGAQTASDSGYWHTQGNRIVNDQGQPVRIASVNWFGMENRFFVPAGLDIQPLVAIMARVKSLGFNTIRLPFSNQVVEQNPVVTAHLDANPDLKGLHALDVLDRIVAAAGNVGVRIILDDQRSAAGTQPEYSGLWYTSHFPESAWLADWKLLTQRYAGNPTVVGVDLRNEPHTGPPGPWTLKAYLAQGSTWGPYKGVENPATDWRLAAERGGNAVLSVNPHLLIFVEGLQLYPEVGQPNGIDSYWWGGILTPARQYPVQLAVRHQLVYSPHEYGPLKWQMAWFGPKMTFSSVQGIWEQHWGYLEKSSFPQEAPIFIGEFGTCGNSAKCVSDRAPGSQGMWFSYLVEYLREHPEIGWSFWALNGTNHVGAVTAQYILRPDWKSLRLPKLVNTLRDLELAPGPG